jgi:hypothetical protein
MKTKLLVFFFAFTYVTGFAQVDLKVDVLGAIFKAPNVALDIAFSEKFSLEGGAIFNIGSDDVSNKDYKRSGIGGFLMGRTYFNPDMGADKFGMGLYGRYNLIVNEVKEATADTDDYANERISAGLVVSWKWVTGSKFLFGLDLGGGYAFVNDFEFDNPNQTALTLDAVSTTDFDPFLRFTVGYRFGGN